MNSGPQLSIGAQGADVVRAQTIFVMMKILGFDQIDGIFGTLTKNAVIDFQQSEGIPADGVIGNGTWSKMPADPDTPVVKRGSKGSAVTGLQKGLLKFGGAGSPTDPGAGRRRFRAAHRSGGEELPDAAFTDGRRHRRSAHMVGAGRRRRGDARFAFATDDGIALTRLAIRLPVHAGGALPLSRLDNRQRLFSLCSGKRFRTRTADERLGWKRPPPSSMRTSTPSTPRSSSCSTRRCAASRSPSAAGSCLPRPTKPRLSACAAACRDGGRASSARSSFSSAAISRTTSGSATPRSRCSAISRRWSSGSPSTKPLPTSRAARICSVRPPRSRPAIRRRVRAELGLPISVGVARTKHLAKIASQVAKPDGLVVVDPDSRARLPARPAGRADVGRRTGHQGAAGRERRAHHRAAGADARRAVAGAAARSARRARSSRRSPGTAIRARSRRIAARTRPARSRRSAGSPPKSASSGRRCCISPTGSAAGCAPNRGPAGP